MCNQTVGLVAAALERRGIATVAIQLLRDVARRVRPPRSLVVPFVHGFPLGQPHDSALQRRVIRNALELIENPELNPPVLVDFVRGESD
jgi:hypothetical protein